MKLKRILPYSQVCWVVLALFFLTSCNGKKEETPVIPPLTSPLSRSFIGYGVVNVSYTRVTAQPEEDIPGDDGFAAASPGYLRRGSVVRILQRRLVRNQEKLDPWVLVDGSSIGWLKESLVDIYDSEPQARTASESMGR
jgi:hypothetical protein